MTHTNIPGILVLEDNKTYGRTANKKRLYYKCIPNNRELPPHLIPYSPDIGFHKKLQNRFIIFVAEEDQTKGAGLHYGKMTENLGETNDLSAFYEYQLYCRDIHSSISQFTKKAKLLIKPYELEDVIEECRNIFTIDPLGTTDHDDALSIESTSSGEIIIKIYIANVYHVINSDLWSSFSEKRLSKIYLPDFKRPMIPEIISEQCSLKQGKIRKVLCLELEYKDDVVISTKLSTSTIRINKNYVYENQELLKNEDYKKLFLFTKNLSPSSINNSHDVVEYWMKKMNSFSAEKLFVAGTGILKEEMGIYKRPCSDKEPIYTHITSPIRRIVDLVNQIEIIDKYIHPVNEEAKQFSQNWMENIEKINTITRSIKKTQIDCDMLYQCSIHPEWTEQSHKGIFVDRTLRKDGLYSYVVHLKENHMYGRTVSSEFYELEESAIFRMYYFVDAERLHRKIRLCIFQ
jgi:exoribonuclease R